jgi:H+/Cl- antiporter ClcA
MLTSASGSLRTHARLLGAALGRHVARLSYLRKWLLLGTLLGVVAGLGAVVFYGALRIATQLLLGDLAGYAPPTPLGEGAGLGSAHFAHPWALPLVVALGGLISGIIVFTFAPEAEGHGTDAAIATVHHNPRGARVRTVIVKILASAATIGAGGSGGREGPTAQISSGFGSLLARVLDLSPKDGRIAVSVGIGSGIGSIFGAPLGGALLSAELLYRDDFEVEALLPGIIASVVGYTVFSAFNGFTPLFGFAGSAYHFHQPIQLAWFVVIGVACGLVGVAYAKGFYGGVELFRRLPVPRAVKPALGGLIVGAIALAMPQVLGTGYGWIQRGLGRSLLSIPLWIVLLLPLARILCTTLSIGSGGSGGIFGPGMVIGAFVGAAAWRLLEPIAPGIPHDPAAFVIVGMMACFGSVSRAPIAVMVMVAEMTGSLQALAPAMLAVGIATLIVGRFDVTMYRSQLRRRSDQPGARLAAGLPLLGSIRVASAMAPPLLVLAASETADAALAGLARESLEGAPVIDGNEVYLGVLDRAADRGKLDSEATVAALADPTVPSIGAQDDLEAGMQALMNAGRDWVPVLDGGKRVIGVLSTGDVVRAHQAAMRKRALASPVAEIERAREAERSARDKQDELAAGVQHAERASARD